MHLDVPLNVFVETAETEIPDPGAWRGGVTSRAAGDPEAITRAVELLLHAERPVVAVVGDGGFLMNPGIVATAVEYGIPVVWLVWNNLGYCSIRDQQLGYFGRDREIATSFEVIASGRLLSADFAAMARAMGARGALVERPGDLREQLELAIASNEPCLLDVRVARDIQPVATGSWDLPPLPHPEPDFGLTGLHEEW